MTIEYICTYCGKKTLKSASSGRPIPSICPRKPKLKNGKGQPHTWRVNRKIGK